MFDVLTRFIWAWDESPENTDAAKPLTTFATTTEGKEVDATLEPETNPCTARGTGEPPEAMAMEVAFTRMLRIVRVVPPVGIETPDSVMVELDTVAVPPPPPLVPVARISVFMGEPESRALVTATAGDRDSWIVAVPTAAPPEQVIVKPGTSSVWPSFRRRFGLPLIAEQLAFWP